MNERAALTALSSLVGGAGDDTAIVDGRLLTIDMLHESTDFPPGTTRYTAGWRAVGASLSDVAAMGGTATAAVAAYAAPAFDEEELADFVRGASDVCELVDASYVGGDLDDHDEFTVATTALGESDDPVLRSGATPDDAVCVTGTFGRSAAALRRFERGDAERGNELFRFEPRVAAGVALAPRATAMMDSSDGLARSLHQLSEASDCGFSIRFDDVPIDASVRDAADDPEVIREMALSFGEDFELVFTVPESDLDAVREASPTPISRIGEAVESGVRMDGEPLPDRGYTH